MFGQLGLNTVKGGLDPCDYRRDPEGQLQFYRKQKEDYLKTLDVIKKLNSSEMPYEAFNSHDGINQHAMEKAIGILMLNIWESEANIEETLKLIDK